MQNRGTPVARSVLGSTARATVSLFGASSGRVGDLDFDRFVCFWSPGACSDLERHTESGSYIGRRHWEHGRRAEECGGIVWKKSWYENII